MILKGQALERVERWLAGLPRATCGSPWVVTDIAEFDQFWLFSWTSRRAEKRGVGMVGNMPLAVSKADGRMYAWGLLYPFEEFVARFRRGELLEVPDAEPGAASDGGGR